MMIDNDLKVHVLEVNGRPQLQSHVLDKAVNRPMLAEMLKIIGKVLLRKSLVLKVIQRDICYMPRPKRLCLFKFFCSRPKIGLCLIDKRTDVWFRDFII